jgi:hypothetical protein
LIAVGHRLVLPLATCRDNLEQAKKVPEGRDSDRCADLGRLHVHAERLPYPICRGFSPATRFRILRQIVGDLDAQVLTVILSGAAGVLAWLATKYNWVGKPIVDARDKRLTALQAAEQNRIVAARTALK